jgi:glycosyltransferase involved in cell wall biosynthesis
MKTLIIATSRKPKNLDEEIRLQRRYRIEYLHLSEHITAPYMDYDPPWMHENESLRKLEEKLHMDFFWARKIASLVKKEGYELVVSMSERIAVPLALFLNKKVKHITFFLNPFSPKWLFVIKAIKIYQRLDKIITPSQAEADALQQELNLPSGKIQALHFCVDTKFFSEAKESYPSIQGEYIFSQGLASRDYPTLIRAMQELKHIECHISAVSAWDQNSTNFGGLPIPDNVIIKQYDHPHIIREALAKSRFSVIPIYPDVGMWCTGATSVLQAQAMGKPIVVTKLAGIAEYLQDRETGFLIKGENHKHMAETIALLWENPMKAKKMGRCGQTWVRENFSFGQWMNKMSQLLESVAI